MSLQQFQLILSWIIGVAALLVVYKFGLVYGLIVLFAAFIFRDKDNEKLYAREFLSENTKLVKIIKTIVFTLSFILFLYVIYSLIFEDGKAVKNHDFIELLIYVVLSPFVILAVKYESSLFCKYKN